MRRKIILETKISYGKIKRALSFFLLVFFLVLQTGRSVMAASNEVVADTGEDSVRDIQLPVEEQQQYISENEVISISMPLKTPFTMNPTKAYGEEQIWSPAFHFQNNSQTAVQVTVRNIRYELDENSPVITHYAPFDRPEERKGKEIYLCLKFGETEVPVGDLSRSYSFTLAAAGEGEAAQRDFSISGMMSCFPEEDWQDGDVSISFQVEYKAMAEKEQTNVLDKEPKEATSEAVDVKKGGNNGLEETAGPLREETDTTWKEKLAAMILAETRQTEDGQEAPEAGTEIEAFVIDSRSRESIATPEINASTGGAVSEEKNAVRPITATGDGVEVQDVFSFSWKQALDLYEKYKAYVPEGMVLVVDANEKAQTPAFYVSEALTAQYSEDMQNTGKRYAFWRNPDYVPEENKVWHIDGETPYYISNPGQAWLWSEIEEAPAETEIVQMWIKEDREDPLKERNAENEPAGNDTGTTTG